VTDSRSREKLAGTPVAVVALLLSCAWWAMAGIFWLMFSGMARD
jgi:hypothetical protein